MTELKSVTAAVTADLPARLRDAFLQVEFTASGVRRVLGPVAETALRRDETVPARRRTSGGAPVDTLIRLFLLQDAVPQAAARDALPLDAALAGGALVADVHAGEVRAAVRIEPYGDSGEDAWWIAADLETGFDGRITPLPDDHVVGAGGASTTLASITVRHPVARSLDIGTGSGVQALHLSRHSDHIVATDVSPRALNLARLTAGLCAVDVELREGSFLEPVAGETFDLVVSNPPFVVAPPHLHTYRAGDLPMDGVTAHLVQHGPSLLTDGGTLQLLGNWLHRRGEPWQERVAGWLPERDHQAAVVQREVQDPAEYAALWLRDSGDVGSPDYPRLYDAWLTALEEEDVEAIGFGFVSIRRTPGSGGADTADIQDWPHAVEHPLGPHIDGDLRRATWLSGCDDDEFAATPLRLHQDVVQEQVGRPGAEHPEHLILRQQGGFRRAVQCDTALAALAGACDGTISVGGLADAVLDLLGVDSAEQPAARDGVLDEVRGLVRQGFLERE